MNPRCQHPSFAPKHSTQKKTQKQVTKPQPSYNRRNNKELERMIKEGVFHFYDFEYAAQFQHDIYPIEIGITTYNLINNKELSYYHRLLSPGKYKRAFDRTTFIHGIDPKDPQLESNYTMIANEIISYNSRFDCPSFYVSKEEQLSGDKLCIEEIFKRGKIPIPSNIKFITHIQLFEEWMKLNSVKLSESPSFILNHVYKQLECAERCDYHKTIDEKYHCALSDARHTALMELICIKKFGGIVNNSESLPKAIFVKSDWDIHNTIALFTNCQFHCEMNIAELHLTLVDLVSFTIFDEKTFYLLPTANIYSQTIGSILELFHRNKWTNESVLESINEYLDSLEFEKDIVVVYLKGKIGKSLPQLHLNHYLGVSVVDFKKQLLMKLSQSHRMEKQKPTVFDAVMKDVSYGNKPICSIHEIYPQECCHRETVQFIATTEKLIQQYPQMIEQYGVVNENKVSKTVVEIKKKEEVITPIVTDVDALDDDNEMEEDTDEMKHSKHSKKMKKARKTVKRNAGKKESRPNVFKHFE